MSQSPQNRDDAAGTPPKTNAPQAGGSRKTRIPLRDRKITVTLSLPKAFFSVFFSLFALIWIFIFGVMIGRGHNPEELVPELANVMPAPAAPAPSDPLPNAPQATTGGGMNDVLRPQDLQYHDSLKNTPEEKPRAQAPAQGTEKPQPTVPSKPSPPSQVSPPAAPKPVPAVSPAPAASAANQDKTIYNYTYQVAAFTNTAAAQAMQKKLRDNGVTTRIAQTESGGTVWHRLLVPFKGTPEETRELREKLASCGISSMILRGKTPAN